MSDTQQRKLRELSLVSILAKSDSNIMTFEEIRRRLNLETDLGVQELVVSAAFRGLLSVKISSSRKHIVLLDFIARDIQIVPTINKQLKSDIQRQLNAFTSRCDETIEMIRAEIDRTKREMEERRNNKIELAAERERVISKIRNDAISKRYENKGEDGEDAEDEVRYYDEDEEEDDDDDDDYTVESSGKGKEPINDEMQIDSQSNRKRKERIKGR